MLVAALGALVGCAPAPAQPTPAQAGPTSAPAGASSQNAALRQVIDGARAEGELELWFTEQDETVRQREQAFNKRFSLNIKFRSVNMSAVTATSRVIAESKAGQKVGDAFEPALQLAYSLVAEDALAKVDWVGTFSSELPGVKEASDVFVPELQGYGLHFWDVPYVLAYNKNLIQRSEVPTRWDDLATEKWRRKFAIDMRGSPFYYLIVAPGWDTQRVRTLVTKLAELNPILPNPSRGEEVVRGEVPLQVVATFTVAQLQAKGAPIDMVVPDTIPFNPAMAVVPSQAKHPNAARLFTAWVTTEGMDILERLEFSNRVTNPTSTMARTLKEQAPNAVLAAPKSLNNLKEMADLSRDLGAEFSKVAKP